MRRFTWGIYVIYGVQNTMMREGEWNFQNVVYRKLRNLNSDLLYDCKNTETYRGLFTITKRGSIEIRKENHHRCSFSYSKLSVTALRLCNIYVVVIAMNIVLPGNMKRLGKFSNEHNLLKFTLYREPGEEFHRIHGYDKKYESILRW